MTKSKRRRVKSDNLQGQRFGYWLVTGFSHKNTKGELHWACQCRCGVVRIVRANSLRSGVSTSCGCYHRQAVTTHGMSSTRTFKTWHGIIQRCHNPKSPDYHRYGGRGIRMCPQWRQSFEQFLADVGSRPKGKTLDRIDVNGDYVPSNCRWSTPAEQQRNRRDTIVLTFNGRTMPVADWADLTGLTRATIVRRVGSGWPMEKALFHPMMRRGPKRRPKTQHEKD